MKVLDRILDRLVPQQEAGACSEYYRCLQQTWLQICYYGCGRPTFCKTIDKCRG